MKMVIVDQIEITSDGHIHVRMKKQIVDDGTFYDLGYHRIVIPVGEDVDMQMAAVNEHLAQMGFGQIASKEIDSIRSHSLIAFTPERIASYAVTSADNALDVMKNAVRSVIV